MHDLVEQARSLRRVANPPAGLSKKNDLRRPATGAQDNILPYYGETH